MTRVFVYETTSADPSCADAELQAQGRSMRDAMVADLMKVDGLQVACAVHSEGESWVRPVNPIRLVQPAAGEGGADFLRRQAALHDLIWVVAPESGGVLATLRAAVSDRQWLGCSAHAIAVTASKRATSRHLHWAGIAATEPHVFDDPPEAALAGGNWIVKPDDGCGAAGARRHRGYARARADYSDRLLRRERAVMEPWIDGEPLSLSLLCGPRDVEVLAINRQRISTDGSGLLRFDGVSPHTTDASRASTLASLAGRIKGAMPGLCGYVGVDLTWHPARGPVVIEINPRVTCSYEGLSQRIGRNVAQQVLALHRSAYESAPSGARHAADLDPGSA